jgi:hypothetical protein
MQSLSGVLEPFEDYEHLSDGSKQSYQATAYLASIKIQNL